MRGITKAKLFFVSSLFSGIGIVVYVHWRKEYARQQMKIAVEQDKKRLAEFETKKAIDKQNKSKIR